MARWKGGLLSILTNAAIVKKHLKQRISMCSCFCSASYEVKLYVHIASILCLPVIYTIVEFAAKERETSNQVVFDAKKRCFILQTLVCFCVPS